VQDVLAQCWYVHNAIAFFLTTQFLGLMYCFIHKASVRPTFFISPLDHAFIFGLAIIYFIQHLLLGLKH
jgi:cbb3-type cytochrome oxidase subunit 1